MHGAKGRHRGGPCDARRQSEPVSAADSAAAEAEAPPLVGAAPTPATDSDLTPNALSPRAGPKQAALIAMLRAPDGATIAEIVAAIGWQPYTVRVALAGALKKALGLAVRSEKVEGRGWVCRLPAA